MDKDVKKQIIQPERLQELYPRENLDKYIMNIAEERKTMINNEMRNKRVEISYTNNRAKLS